MNQEDVTEAYNANSAGSTLSHLRRPGSQLRSSRAISKVLENGLNSIQIDKYYDYSSSTVGKKFIRYRDDGDFVQLSNIQEGSYPYSIGYLLSCNRDGKYVVKFQARLKKHKSQQLNVNILNEFNVNILNEFGEVTKSEKFLVRNNNWMQFEISYAINKGIHYLDFHIDSKYLDIGLQMLVDVKNIRLELTYIHDMGVQIPAIEYYEQSLITPVAQVSDQITYARIDDLNNAYLKYEIVAPKDGLYKIRYELKASGNINITSVSEPTNILDVIVPDEVKDEWLTYSSVIQLNKGLNIFKLKFRKETGKTFYLKTILIDNIVINVAPGRLGTTNYETLGNTAYEKVEASGQRLIHLKTNGYMAYRFRVPREPQINIKLKAKNLHSVPSSIGFYDGNNNLLGSISIASAESVETESLKLNLSEKFTLKVDVGHVEIADFILFYDIKTVPVNIFPHEFTIDTQKVEIVSGGIFDGAPVDVLSMITLGASAEYTFTVAVDGKYAFFAWITGITEDSYLDVYIDNVNKFSMKMEEPLKSSTWQVMRGVAKLLAGTYTLKISNPIGIYQIKNVSIEEMKSFPLDQPIKFSECKYAGLSEANSGVNGVRAGIPVVLVPVNYKLKYDIDVSETGTYDLEIKGVIKSACVMKIKFGGKVYYMQMNRTDYNLAGFTKQIFLQAGQQTIEFTNLHSLPIYLNQFSLQKVNMGDIPKNSPIFLHGLQVENFKSDWDEVSRVDYIVPINDVNISKMTYSLTTGGAVDDNIGYRMSLRISGSDLYEIEVKNGTTSLYKTKEELSSGLPTSIPLIINLSGSTQYNLDITFTPKSDPLTAKNDLKVLGMMVNSRDIVNNNQLLNRGQSVYDGSDIKSADNIRGRSFDSEGTTVFVDAPVLLDDENVTDFKDKLSLNTDGYVTMRYDFLHDGRYSVMPCMKNLESVDSQVDFYVDDTHMTSFVVGDTTKFVDYEAFFDATNGVRNVKLQVSKGAIELDFFYIDNCLTYISSESYLDENNPEDQEELQNYNRVDASSYIHASGITIIADTSDNGEDTVYVGRFQDNAFLEYNLFVEKAGDYIMTFQIAGLCGSVEIHANDSFQKTTNFQIAAGWTTQWVPIRESVRLNQGMNRLKLVTPKGNTATFGIYLRYFKFELMIPTKVGDVEYTDIHAQDYISQSGVEIKEYGGEKFVSLFDNGDKITYLIDYTGDDYNPGHPNYGLVLNGRGIEGSTSIEVMAESPMGTSNTVTSITFFSSASNVWSTDVAWLNLKKGLNYITLKITGGKIDLYNLQFSKFKFEIELFDGANFSGASVIVNQEGTLASSGFIDKVSSFKVKGLLPGTSVAFYKNTGVRLDYVPGIEYSDLSHTDFENSIYAILSVPYTGNGVAIYNDPNYTGKFHTFVSDIDSTQNIGMLSTVSSIKVLGLQPGKTLRMYQGTGYTGESMDYPTKGMEDSNVSRLFENLSNTPFDNNIQSLQFVDASLNQVVLYTASDYNQKGYVLTNNKRNLSTIGMNDQVSSIKVLSLAPGKTLRMHDASEYSGGSMDYPVYSGGDSNIISNINRLFSNLAITPYNDDFSSASFVDASPDQMIVFSASDYEGSGYVFTYPITDMKSVKMNDVVSSCCVITVRNGYAFAFFEAANYTGRAYVTNYSMRNFQDVSFNDIVSSIKTEVW